MIVIIQVSFDPDGIDVIGYDQFTLDTLLYDLIDIVNSIEYSDTDPKILIEIDTLINEAYKEFTSNHGTPLGKYQLDGSLYGLSGFMSHPSGANNQLLIKLVWASSSDLKSLKKYKGSKPVERNKLGVRPPYLQVINNQRSGGF